ncbi:hypothetical protein [Burkholderia cepacia]|uniref:hypothetical protein n=1 Tax=Burkholderia cepacia TaxID=292 RepID=UPI0012D86A8A|nr:hypothetical protein [Burkholderia cepacia]
MVKLDCTELDAWARIGRPAAKASRSGQPTRCSIATPTKMVAGFASRFIGIITTFCGIVRER